MKTLVLLSLVITVAVALTSCVAANNNVRKDYDPPEHYRGRHWN